jgi:hypothetical protein
MNSKYIYRDASIPNEEKGKKIKSRRREGNKS